MSQEFHTGDDLRFDVKGHIARGGFSEVYEASLISGLDQNPGEPYALKVFNRDGPDEHGVDMFRREINAFEHIGEHPNIISRVEHGVGRLALQNVAVKSVLGELMDRSKRPYLLMEYAKGGAVSRQGVLPVPQAVTTANNIADALAHIHGHGLVYRDLKPENILVTGDNLKKPVFKLGDLGAVEGAFDPRNPKNTRQSIGIATLASTHKGEIERREATARTDVYALGLLLGRLLTGVAPKMEAGATPLTLEELVRKSKVAWNYQISALEGVYATATQDNPMYRHSSAQHFKWTVNEAIKSANPTGNVSIFDLKWEYKPLNVDTTNRATVTVENRTVLHTQLHPQAKNGGTRVMSGTAVADLMSGLEESNGEAAQLKKDKEDLERQKGNLQSRANQQDRSLKAANDREKQYKAEIEKLKQGRPQVTRRGFGKGFLLGAAMLGGGFAGWEWYKEKYKFNPDIESIGLIVTEELDPLISSNYQRSVLAKSLIDAGNNEAAIVLINKLEEDEGASYLAAETASWLSPSDPDSAYEILKRIHDKEAAKDDPSLLDEIRNYFIRLAPYKPEIAGSFQDLYQEADLIWQQFNSALDHDNTELAKKTIQDLLDEGYYWHATRLAETLAPYQAELIDEFANQFADDPELFSNHLAALDEYESGSRPYTGFDVLNNFAHSLVPHDTKLATELLKKIEKMARIDTSHVFYSCDLAVRLAAFDPEAAESMIEVYTNEPEYTETGSVLQDAVESLRLALMPDNEPEYQPFAAWRDTVLDPSSLRNINTAVASLKAEYEDEGQRARYAYLVAKSLVYAHSDLGIIKNTLQLLHGRNGWFLDPESDSK